MIATAFAALALSMAGATSTNPLTTVSFVLPTQYTDGAALPVTAIRGVEVDWGLCTATGGMPASPTSFEVTAPSTAGNLTLPSLGNYCFTVKTVLKATDSAGKQIVSAPSVVATKTLISETPNAPSGINVQ